MLGWGWMGSSRLARSKDDTATGTEAAARAAAANAAPALGVVAGRAAAVVSVSPHSCSPNVPH